MKFSGNLNRLPENRLNKKIIRIGYVTSLKNLTHGWTEFKGPQKRKYKVNQNFRKIDL